MEKHAIIMLRWIAEAPGLSRGVAIGRFGHRPGQKSPRRVRGVDVLESLVRRGLVREGKAVGRLATFLHLTAAGRRELRRMEREAKRAAA